MRFMNKMNNQNLRKLQGELIDLLESQVMDLTIMSKIELGDDVIAEIKRLKDLIRKSKYNQIIDEAWKNYIDKTRFTSNPKWLEPVPIIELKTGENDWGARQYYRDGFIDKCKTDNEFSERWGLKIEERELSLEERLNLVSTIIGEEKIRTHEDNLARVDKLNTPTKLITITSNNETIEVYE